MKRCLDLATQAQGLTYPNPLVGAVIVHNGLIIGEGYHVRSGEPHAEVIAIKSVFDRSKLPLSTLYVNLEPCSHFGKTPPCADLIISEGIKKVIIGIIDPNELVAGKGVQKLKSAGCEVITGVLENEARLLNRRFFTFHEKKRPYIILKWAQSNDGFIDFKREKSNKPGPNWITGKPEKVLVHKWRASEQAILAGGNTIRTDDPMLTVRDWSGKDPVRVILTGSGNVSNDSAIFKLNGTNIVFTNNSNVFYQNTDVVILNKAESAASQITAYMYSLGIQSVIIEGGAETLSGFIKEDLWDEARIFKGKTKFNNGIKAPTVNGFKISQNEFSKSVLEVVHNGSQAVN